MSGREITLSRELLFSGFLSGRLFPESVLMREPLESAFLTLLMLGVEAVYGDAEWTRKRDPALVRWHKIKRSTRFQEELFSWLVFFYKGMT